MIKPAHLIFVEYFRFVLPRFLFHLTLLHLLHYSLNPNGFSFKPLPRIEAIIYCTMAAVLPHSSSHELSFEPISLPVPRIRSNEGEYVEQKSLGWMRPTSANETLQEMWRRFEDDGYLLIKGLIPRKDVLDMREQ
jgi:hypothetical protein